MIKNTQKSGLSLFICLALLIFWTGCSKIDEPGETVAKTNQKIPDQESWGSTIDITRDGKPVARVWAGYIAFYQETQEVILRDSIHADFFDSEGNHNSYLIADSGRIDQKTNNLTTWGRVKVVSDSGIVLLTEELKWENARQKIVCDVPVQFTTDTDTLYGDSFISDPDLKNYEIKNTRGYSKRKLPLNK